MSGERKLSSDLELQARELRHGGWRGRAARRSRYARIMYRLYMGLLLFVVVAGIPILGIPSLRHRLQQRAEILRAALLARSQASPPVVARIGENAEPFPKEYEIPLQTWFQTPGTVQFRAPVFRAGAETEVPASAEGQAAVAETENDAAAVDFRQGAAEQEAYDLVLKSSELLAGMVQGRDPSLRFVRWAAARRDEDTYWVDITFTRSADGTEARYIWQVNVASKKVMPLSSLARALGKP
ncbi:MAG: hypothetical protein HXY20_08260 [Acidobacteria bacterium]|nr:hypothetical protein [Acidobacteriota bacterium]